ncbi:hypothetical protein JCM8547_002986 [Rhodosporidiobolus lusitaniae]
MTEPHSTALVSTKGGTDEEREKREDGQREDEDLVVAGSSVLEVEEDKVEKEKDGAVKRSPFDKLPDGVLEIILEEAMESAPPNFVDLLTVNKRFFRLARPRWFAEWYVGGDEMRKVLGEPSTWPFFRRFALSSYGGVIASFSYECAVLAQLQNLTHLEPVDRITQGEQVVLPIAFTDALRLLKNLKSLAIDLNQGFSFSDASFSVGRDLLQLRMLHLGPGSRCAAQLLAVSCPGLRELNTIWAWQDSQPTPAVPWASVVSIVAFLGPLQVSNLVGSLEGYLNSSTPPPSLPLKRLRLRGLALWDAQDFDFEKRNKLEMSILQMLKRTSLLECFPSLRNLELHGAKFEGTSPPSIPRRELDPTSSAFIVAYPTLFALLAVLVRTTVRRSRGSLCSTIFGTVS